MWWRRLRYVLALIGLCAIATCPSARRSCTAHNRAREADQLLDYLAERVGTVVASTGKLPPLAAGPTPQPSCCEQGGTCDPDSQTWSAPGWRALGFEEAVLEKVFHKNAEAFFAKCMPQLRV